MVRYFGRDLTKCEVCAHEVPMSDQAIAARLARPKPRGDMLNSHSTVERKRVNPR